MQKKLTITIEEDLYRGLQEQVGRGNISNFIEDLIRPHIMTKQDVEEGYRLMAADSEREAQAREWAEGLIGESLQ